jgi:membrane protein DedA with SNARE-associated domain
VFRGRVTPVVRSFISIPAGVLDSPLGPYTVLTLLGSLLWCFAFAGVGWAVGGSWESFHHSFRYADYAVVAALIAAAGLMLLHRRRRRVAS